MSAIINGIGDYVENTNQELPTIVVTGFGLFRNYKLNPSWECVQRLRLKGVHLVVLGPIPVAYDDVEKIVDQIWSQYKPSLVIHCGVSCLAKCITLEKKAIRSREHYVKPDIYGRLPNGVTKQSVTQNNKLITNDQKCKALETNDSYECIECQINLEKVCDKVSQQFRKGSIRMPAVLSSNAGRFLCEYIFSRSLKESTERTAFIHVPEQCDKCPLEDIGSALEYTIQALIEEVLKSE